MDSLSEVIAASEQTVSQPASAAAATHAPAATHAQPTVTHILLLAGWAGTVLVMGRRNQWFNNPRVVRWRVNTYGNLLLCLCGLAIAPMVGSIVGSLAGANANEVSTPHSVLGSMAASGSLTLFMWWWLWNRHATHEPCNAMPASHAAIMGAVGLAAIWPWMVLISHTGEWLHTLGGGTPAPDIAHSTLQLLMANSRSISAWMIGLLVVTLTPITEEILWRGAAQQWLKSVGLPRGIAIAVTALLFALVHWGAVPADARFSALPALLALGIALGWLMERTGNLIAPIAAHAAFNAVNLLLFSMLP